MSTMNTETLCRPVEQCDDVWPRLFGRFIQGARWQTTRSIEEAARLARIEPKEWQGLEAGQLIPATLDQLLAVMAAVDLSLNQMVSILQLCRESWGL